MKNTHRTKKFFARKLHRCERIKVRNLGSAFICTDDSTYQGFLNSRKSLNLFKVNVLNSKAKIFVWRKSNYSHHDNMTL